MERSGMSLCAHEQSQYQARSDPHANPSGCLRYGRATRNELSGKVNLNKTSDGYDESFRLWDEACWQFEIGPRL